MTVNATIQALQTLHAGITGVAAAPLPAAYPERLSAATLPLVLVFPLPGDWSLEAAAALRRHERSYSVQVFIVSSAPKSAIAGSMDDCAVLLQRFGETYIDPSKQLLAAHITLDTSKVGDNGIELLQYGGGSAYGFAFKVGIYENW